VRKSLKVALIICSIVVIVFIGLVVVSVHSAKYGAICNTITLTGEITPQTFLAVKDCLVNSEAKTKTFVVTNSGGGSWESGLALGILIHRHGWDVEIVDLCASSCANFIFPAGKVKYLHEEALLLFHGGPHQHNVIAQLIEADNAAANGSLAAVANPDRARMEGHIVVDDQGAQRLQVLEFLSITNITGPVDLASRLIKASDQFYQDLGVNFLLPHYGQIGKYEPIYKAYEYGGFVYGLDSLRRLGIGSIEMKGGEWRPERHRDFHDVYEVVYP
jgi:hypothetical protein